MTEVIEWRKLRINRDERFDSLVGKLCSTKGGGENEFVFGTVKELMIFAAVVGFQLDEFKPLESKKALTPILLETYANTSHDAYIYLIALARRPDLEVLKDQNLKTAISIFEGYCNAGLHHIDNWVLENIGEPLLKNILFNQTLKFLSDDE